MDALDERDDRPAATEAADGMRERAVAEDRGPSAETVLATLLLRRLELRAITAVFGA